MYIALSALAFTFIAWYRFHLGLAVLFVLLPTYLIRFNIGPLPTTVLEVMIGIVVAVWLVKMWNAQRETHNKNYLSLITYHLSHNKLLFIGIILLLTGATISVATSLNLRAALGEWKAFYIEPVLIFLILITLKEKLSPIAYHLSRITYHVSTINLILYGLLLSGLLTSILAIYQHFTGFAVPYAFWENGNSYRVTAWYGFPNAVGLFLAPLLPFALYVVHQTFTILRTRDRRYVTGDNKNRIVYRLSLIIPWLILILSLLFIPSSLIAIFYAKSTGALIGILAGIFVLLLLYKKTRIASVIILASGILTLTLLPATNPIKQELFFQDRSGQIRVAMYKETLQFLKDHPILGAGLASYTKRIEPYHTTVNGEGIEIFHHPHNIFLTMWVNTGIVGLAGFVLIIIWFYQTGLKCVEKLKIGNWKFQYCWRQ